MGYCMEQTGCDFRIKKENIQKAWDSLIELFKKEKKSIKDSSGYHYSFINTEDVLNAESFEAAMEEIRWTVIPNALTGDIEDIMFNGEKLGGDEEILFGSIAPYVEKGSYIEMEGEDGHKWRWKFTNNKVEEVNGHWVWNDIEDESEERWGESNG